MNKTNSILFLVCVAFIVNFNSLFGVFLVDDLHLINDIKANNITLDPAYNLNRVVYHLFGARPFYYHLSGVLLHFIAVALVFIFLSRIFSQPAAFMGSLLFAVYPHEAVSWVSGRVNIINAIVLLSILLLLWKNRFWNNLLALLIFFYYSLANYPWAFLIGCSVIMTEIVLHKRFHFYKLAFFLLPLVVCLLHWKIAITRAASITNIMGLPNYVRNPILLFVYSININFWHLIFPIKLGFYYEPFFYTALNSAFAWMTTLGLIYLVIRCYKAQKVITWTILLFIIMLAITYAPMPFASFMADRYDYVPCIGLAMVMAWIAEKGER